MIDNLFGDSDINKIGIKNETPKDDTSRKEIKEITENKTEAKTNTEVKQESEHARILREHGGLESNIPMNSHYWRIRP